MILVHQAAVQMIRLDVLHQASNVIRQTELVKSVWLTLTATTEYSVTVLKLAMLMVPARQEILCYAMTG